MSVPAVRVLDQQEPCSRCGKLTFMLVRLHGERGGPELCPDCKVQKQLDQKRKDKEWDRVLGALGGGLFGPDTADDEEVCRELIDEALTLTHPDRHSPERNALATRVTAELTRLREFAKPRAKPEPAPGQATSELALDQETVADLEAIRHPTYTYPCESCHGLSSLDYCDACRARWEADQQARRERLNARARERRRERRTKRRCRGCRRTFTPQRSDGRYCSDACRQRGYRRRVTAKKSPTLLD